jgi:hypothetical protein
MVTCFIGLFQFGFSAMETDKPASGEDISILLRFRDMVTEPRGNIAEHARLIDEFGYAWWGWWARNQEKAPRDRLAELFLDANREMRVILFDTGLMECYETRCSRVVLAPGSEGIGSPDFRATPHYYVRGRYPAWFRLHGPIEAVDRRSFTIAERPTLGTIASSLSIGKAFGLDELRDERPTLWFTQDEERDGGN